MRHATLLLGLVVAALAGPCETAKTGSAPDGPAILATGNANNLYVAAAAQVDDVSGFRYWQRDAQGMWHDGGFARGTPAAAAAWREDLIVFFPSGRWGRFGLARPVIEPSPVPAWVPVAACEDGLAADAFGYNRAGEPFQARYEDGKWTAAQVEAGVEREKMIDPRAVRYRGRLFLLWREEVPTLTGAAPDVRLRFLYHERDRWHGPITSRLAGASAYHVAADAETMACLFLKPLGDDRPRRWTLATYATADEDWHETGPLVGTVPDGPIALARSGRQFFVVAVRQKRPVVASLDVPRARVGAFMPLAAQGRESQEDRADYSMTLLFAVAAFSAVLMLATWRRARLGARSGPVPPPGTGGPVDAPLLRRAAALGIDYLLVSLPVGVLYVSYWPDLLDRIRQGQITFLDAMASREMIVLHAVFMAAIILYFSVAEAVFACTLGKRLMGLEVRAQSGAKVAWWQAVVRNVLRVVDDLPGGLYLVGLLLILMGPRPQRLGDRLARTLVVVSGSAEPGDAAGP